MTEVGWEREGNLRICAERKEASGYPAKDEMSKTKEKPTIFAYGFDAAGFAAPSDPQELPKLLIRFVPYASEESLESADGIITPSGIFEEWESSNSYRGSSSWLVCKNKDHMAKVFQNFNRGGWIAFLLRSVNNGNRRDWMDTDLAKRLLNPFFYEVACHDPNPHIYCKADEFSEYLHDYG